MPGPASEIETVLAACLDDLAAGATRAQCLERYAAYADDLKPFLTISDRLYERWPVMSAGARARGRERLHRALDERPARFFGWLPLWEQAVALVLIVASLTAAWLAWPGPKKPLPPAGVNTAPPLASPSLQPSPAMPTAGPLQEVVPTAPTPMASTIAPRTATPDLTPTPTPATAVPALWQATSMPGLPTAPASADAPPSATPTATVQPTRTDEARSPRPSPGTTFGPPAGTAEAPRATGTPEDYKPQPASKSRPKDHPATAKANARATPKSHSAAAKPTEEPQGPPDPATLEPPKRAARPATPNPPAAAPAPTEEPPAAPTPRPTELPTAVQAPATAEPAVQPTADSSGPRSAPPHPKEHATAERPVHPSPTASRSQKGK